MAEKKLLRVKNDAVFKMFFADERNREFLTGFLKSVLKLPDNDYNEIVIADPHLLRDFAGGKLGVIDVKLRTNSGKVIQIEIQLKVTHEIHGRIAFYGSKLITGQLGESDNYSKINQVICIIITNETLVKKSPGYHHRFTFYDYDAKIELNDLIEIHTLELSKLPEQADGTALYDWAKFIDAESEEELKMVAERNPEVQKAAVKLMEFSADEKARDIADLREKEQRDIEMWKDFGIRQGREQERERWQSVVAGKDAELADNRAALVEKDAALASMSAEIERLRSLRESEK